MTSTFDWPAFRAAVIAVIEARDLTDRAAARAIGVSPSTVTRSVRQGDSASVENVAKIADWAGLPLDAFMQRRHPVASPRGDDVRVTVAALRASEAAAAALRLLLGTVAS